MENSLVTKKNLNELITKKKNYIEQKRNIAMDGDPYLKTVEV